MADISKIKTPNGTTYDISVPRNKVGKTNDHLENGLDAVSQAMILDHAANKTFGLPANAITVEYSTDGGSTWKDYGATDAEKKNLFSETRSARFYLGKNSTTGTATTNHRLRVTIEQTDRYVELNAVYVWMSDAANTVYMNMEKSTIGSPNTFVTVFSGQRVAGWSGANIRYFSPIRFGGYSDQTSHSKKIRLTFYQTAVRADYGASYVSDIRFYGNAWFIKANNMMTTNHMYSWDADMNVTFPAHVTATYFEGTSKLADSARQIRYTSAIVKCGSAVTANNLIVAGTDGLYKHLKSGTAFDVRFPIYDTGSSVSANGVSSDCYSMCTLGIGSTQSITLTTQEPIYIKGHLNGTVFTPISTAPLTQTVPTSADGCQYIFLGMAYSSNSFYLMPEHPIYQFRDGKFALYEELPNDTLDIQKKQYIQQLKDLCLFAEIANGN